jgi:membrane protein
MDEAKGNDNHVGTTNEQVDLWTRLAMHKADWSAIARLTIRSIGEDDCFMRAASIAYYTLISLFPLLLILVVAASFVLESAEVQKNVMLLVETYIPTASDLVQANFEQILRARGTAGILATLVFGWLALAVFFNIERALNRVWGVKRLRPFWSRMLLALIMVAGIGLLILLSVLSTTVFDIIRHLRLPFLGWEPFNRPLLWHILTSLLPTVLNVAIFFLLYRILPYTLVGWSEVWPGALLAGLAWEAVKRIFSLYLARFGSYNLIYGSLGTVIALLIWFYLTGIIVLLGAEFTEAYTVVRRWRKRWGYRLGGYPPVR